MPPELADGQDNRVRLPRPQVLVIEEKPDGIFLFRYTADGRFGGDTWHQDLAEAREQAEYEYEGALGAWREVPADVRDAHAFALDHVGDGTPR
jgi:hypothetical protein